MSSEKLVDVDVGEDSESKPNLLRRLGSVLVEFDGKFCVVFGSDGGANVELLLLGNGASDTPGALPGNGDRSEEVVGSGASPVRPVSLSCANLRLACASDRHLRW